MFTTSRDAFGRKPRSKQAARDSKMLQINNKVRASHVVLFALGSRITPHLVKRLVAYNTWLVRNLPRSDPKSLQYRRRVCLKGIKISRSRRIWLETIRLCFVCDRNANNSIGILSTQYKYVDSAGAGVWPNFRVWSGVCKDKSYNSRTL